MKRLSKFLFLILSGITAALITTEILLRIFYPGQVVYSPTLFAYKFDCYHALPFYWLGLKPNASCIFHTNAGSFPDFIVKTNSLGFRSPEIKQREPPDTRRVLFVGDSFTMGLGVKEEEAFPKRVENLINSSASARLKIDSINAGVPGTGPTYYYLLLKHEIQQIKPDVVVVGFYMFNDIEGVKYAVWQDLDPNGLPDKSDSSIQYVDLQGNLLAKDLPLKYKIPYLRQLHTFALLADFLTTTKTNSLVGPSGLPAQICLYKYFCHDLDDARQRTEKLFLGMKKIAQDNHAKFLVVLIPSEYRVDPLSNSKYGLPPLLPNDRDYAYNIFSQFFNSNKIDYLRLLPQFEKKPNQEYYLKNDEHWNSLGHRIAAQLISQKLKSYLQ